MIRFLSFSTTVSSSIVVALLLALVLIIIQCSALSSSIFVTAAPVFDPGTQSYAKIDPLNTQSPNQVTYDPDFDLFVIAVTGSNKIYSYDANTQTFTHLAGSGAVGGDNANPGITATFNQPTGITIYFAKGGARRGLVVSDTGTHMLRRVRYPEVGHAVDPVCGVVDTPGFAVGDCGTTTPRFNAPAGIDYHLGLKIWAIAEKGSHTITLLDFDPALSNTRRKHLLAGTVDTPGSADGLATVATFNEPYAVALFPRDSPTPQALFISEHGAARLRRLIAVSDTGTVSTIFDHGAANKGWGLDHRPTGAIDGELLWWNDFNGLYHMDMTISDAGLPPASIPKDIVGFKCGDTDITWPATFTNWRIFAMKNSASTAATDYDMVTIGTSCTSTTTTTTVVPPPPTTEIPSTPPSTSPSRPSLAPPVPGETYINDVVAMRPDCSATTDSTSCPSQYSSSSSCVCPPQTASVNITLVDVGAVNSNTNTLSPVSASTSETCGAGEIVIGLCSTASSVDSSSSTMSAFITTDEGNSINCLQTNPETGDCSCPENRTLAFPLLMPALVSNTSGSDFFEPRTRTTFCMPLGQAVYWSGDDENSNRAEDSSPSSSCIHPLGENYTCECGSSLLAKRIPAVVYNNTQLLNTGALTFCGEVSTAVPTTPLQPSTVSPAISTITIAASALGTVAGANLAILQGAALMLSISCDDITAVQPQGSTSSGDKTGSSPSASSSSSSSSSRSSMVTFQTIEAAGEAKGWVYMFILAVSIPGLHALVVTSLALIHWFKSTPIRNYEAESDDRSNNNNSNNSESTSDEDILSALDIMRDSTDRFSFSAQWQGAAIQLKFPHFSLYLTNLVFAGLASESAILIVKAGTPAYLALGVFGLVLCICYIVFVGYLCHYRKQQQLEDDAETQRKMKKEADRRQKALLELLRAQSDSLQTGAEHSKLVSVESVFLSNNDNFGGSVSPEQHHQQVSVHPAKATMEEHSFFDSSVRAPPPSSQAENTGKFMTTPEIQDMLMNRKSRVPSTTNNVSKQSSRKNDDNNDNNNNNNHDNSPDKPNNNIESNQNDENQRTDDDGIVPELALFSALSITNSKSNSGTKDEDENILEQNKSKKKPHKGRQGTTGSDEHAFPTTNSSSYDDSLATKKTVTLGFSSSRRGEHGGVCVDYQQLQQAFSRNSPCIQVQIPGAKPMESDDRCRQQSTNANDDNNNIHSNNNNKKKQALVDRNTNNNINNNDDNLPPAFVCNSLPSSAGSSGAAHHHPNLKIILSESQQHFLTNSLETLSSGRQSDVGAKNEEQVQKVEDRCLTSMPLILNVDLGVLQQDTEMFPGKIMVADEQVQIAVNDEETKRQTSSDDAGRTRHAHTDIPHQVLAEEKEEQKQEVVLAIRPSAQTSDHDMVVVESVVSDHVDDEAQNFQTIEMVEKKNDDCMMDENNARVCRHNKYFPENGSVITENFVSSAGKSSSIDEDDADTEHRFFWPPPLYSDLSPEERAQGCSSCCCSTDDEEDNNNKTTDDENTQEPHHVNTHLQSLFTPKGLWFADYRNFNRRFGALFFLYTPTGAAWAPVATLFFLLVVAIVSSLNGRCEVSLYTLGALHAVLALLFLWKQPTNVSFDNALLVLQYFAGSALAFSRGAKYSESLVFFTCILVIAIVSVVHAAFQYLFEEKVLLPKKKLVFRSVSSSSFQEEKNASKK